MFYLHFDLQQKLQLPSFFYFYFKSISMSRRNDVILYIFDILKSKNLGSGEVVNVKTDKI